MNIIASTQALYEYTLEPFIKFIPIMEQTKHALLRQ